MNRSRRVSTRILAVAVTVVMATLGLAVPAHAASSYWSAYTRDSEQEGYAAVQTTWSGCTPIQFNGTVWDNVGWNGYDVVVWAYIHYCDGTYGWLFLGATHNDGPGGWAFAGGTAPNASGAWLHVCLVQSDQRSTNHDNVIGSTCSN